MTKGHDSYLNMFQNNSLEWYPEYTVALGAYAEELAADLSQYWNPTLGVYQRNFANGMVLVNHGTTAGISLGGTYHLVASSGGGAVPSNGSQPG